MATPRSGRPTAVQTPDMIEKVRELISTYRRMSLRMMVKELEISRVTIRKISENGRSELGLFPTV
jgi:DNA invertase Pin-like site-specific DNA recombinase